MTNKQTAWYLGIGVSLTVVLLSLALRQNLDHFCEPSEIIHSKIKQKKCKRIGGIVVEHSVKQLTDGAVEFQLSDTIHRMTIHYAGLLPTLFREGQGIIAVGEFSSTNLFMASDVLAKHDETYTPLTPKAKKVNAMKASIKVKPPINSILKQEKQP